MPSPYSFFKLFQTTDQQVYLFPIVAVALVAAALALTISFSAVA